MSATDAVTVTLTGQGKRTIITHPDTVAVVPTVYSFTPAGGGIAGGTMVTVLGNNFTGTVATTGVKFGATNATAWVVLDDDHIVAVAPAHTAGGVSIVVTNATGPSITGGTFTYA